MRVAVDRLTYEDGLELQIAAASYWSIAAESIAALAMDSSFIPGHAGHFETSLMLAIAPELVRLEDRPSDDVDRQPIAGTVGEPGVVRRPGVWERSDGRTDDAARASAALGEQALATMSADIADYLVESHGRSDFAPYADDPQFRSRERLFMTTWDSVVVPMFARSLRDSASFDAAERKRLVGHVSEMVKTLQLIGLDSVDNLLAIHCGPFWVRMQWLADRSPLPGVVEEYISATKWLGLAAATPAVANTLPDRAEAEARLRAMF